MKALLVSISIALAIGSSKTVAGSPRCKCGPNDSCWPSNQTWADFNGQIEGRLIQSKPLAISCYPGPLEDRAQCDFVAANWANETFQTTRPLGLAYPINVTCPPVNFAVGETPTSCTLGSNPRYAVNATTREHIQKTLAFATKYNVRVVVKSTGHDISGRSDGYGSLELWLRHHRNGIEFQTEYAASDGCRESRWKGSAIKIGGAYQWTDVYAVAKENRVIVVGGGSPSVGAVGGWATGGGHGPATRNYGLGADQIIEAEVVLADGTIVTANACEYADLYKALRGGGPGYGIILSFTVKAHLEADAVAVQRVEIAPRTPNSTSGLLDAVAILFQSYPEINDAGWAGYAFWYLNSITPTFGNSSAGYYHTFWNIGTPLSSVQHDFDAISAKLTNLDVTVNVTYKQYPSYWTMYDAESNLHDPVGISPALTSRLFSPSSVSNYDKVREYVEIASGSPEDFTSNVILLVSGGQVFSDASDPHSGLNPTWRKSHFANVVGRGWAPESSEEIKNFIRNDVTNVKGKAQKAIAPDMGGYMNEGDRLDPEWRKTFYGEMYKGHEKTKRRVDPEGLFYCPTCVGSEEWVENGEGVLCRV